MYDQPKLPFNERRISMQAAIAAGIVLAAVAFALGILLTGGRVGAASAAIPSGADLAPVWKAWQVIDDKFVPAAVASTSSTSTDPTTKRIYGMIQGLAESLDDPYTYFLPPTENEQFAEDMSGEFSGVGMEIAVQDQILMVVSPLKGTPAERAGIKAGDKILKIDGNDTKGLDISTAVSRIRGPKGTQVTLQMYREGWTEPREVKVTREIINVPIVETTRADGIFTIELRSFTANSPELFRNALREFVESGDSKLLIDLRGNPGGYLEAAVDMASWFLPAGRVVVSEDYAGHAENIVHRSKGYDIFNENLKLAILADRGSASASEILIGALHHWNDAKLIGVNTFGKGSVQELVEITPQTSLKITVARWLAPNGKQIPLDGIPPDIEVKISDEDIKAGKDPQLDAAIKYLKSL